MSAIPPTTPPTMAPMFVFEEPCEAPGIASLLLVALGTLDPVTDPEADVLAPNHVSASTTECFH